MTDVSSEIYPDFIKMKVPDLEKELKLRGLSTTGNETELLKDSPTSMKSPDVAGLESVDDLEENLLNDDDDDEHLDANESVILDNQLDKSLKPLNTKLIETEDDTISEEEPPKKVILTTNENINNTVTSEDKPDVQKFVEMDQRKEEKTVIKLSQFSAKERLGMRAKKFGVTFLNPDAMKAVRAERFGKSNGNNSANSITSSQVTSVEKLKQRAIRFGGSVSTVMSNLENREKLEKRKARFDASANGVVPESEKAKLRLERFEQLAK